MEKKEFKQHIKDNKDITELLNKYRNLGDVGTFGKKTIYVKRFCYHSSGGNNFTTVILSKWEGTPEELRETGREIERILTEVAPHSKEIMKLPEWTEEEKSKITATRKYYEKFNICVDYIKKYVITPSVKFYTITEFVSSELYKDNEFSSYEYNTQDNYRVTEDSRTFKSLLWYVDKNLLALNPKEYIEKE